MRRGSAFGIACAVGVCAIALVADGGVNHAQEITVGEIAGLTPMALGAPPATEPTPLTLGVDVVFGERLETGERGLADVRLLDESTLRIAPNSALTIDTFVYDPASGPGQIVASFGKGIMRYVGGHIGKQTDVVFTTPSAVIGIRGSIMTVEVTPTGQTRATFLGGVHMNVTAAGVTRTVDKPGYSVTVERTGMAPSEPRPATHKEIAQVNHALAAGAHHQTSAASHGTPASHTTGRQTSGHRGGTGGGGHDHEHGGHDHEHGGHR